MRFDCLQDWLSWLESNYPINEIELGLARVAQVAGRLNLASTLAQKKVVTIAGTNGKGSCVAALNALLRSGGFQVACFTSPHFINYNERIVINDKPVSDLCLIEAFDRVDQARESVPLTYFEFGTLVALDVFQRSEVDVVILEVGLGGRLDAVNIIDPDVAIVTSIDIDHQDWLGSDRESIGKEKAGIFRAAKPAVCADPDPPLSIQQTAARLGAKLFQRGAAFSMQEGAGQSYRWQGMDKSANKKVVDLARLALPSGSVAAALQALVLLELDHASVDYLCLEELVLAGRFQCVDNGLASGQGQVILDVAHNPAAAQHLSKKLESTPVKGSTFALIAMMKDKDSTGVIEALKNQIDSWVVADLYDTSRAMVASDLAAIIVRQGITQVTVGDDIAQAYQQVRCLMGAQDRLIVLGSFITVSEVMKIVASARAPGGHA
ncbi:MAG: bifunctional tetrahydrofolate synthase/dihydrofolate synthase [Spongiibacteraceae bacterium]|nr:bifunctional tetrahydrofolate synthase/dihydrofolate synthase [Spongiibacteraceae bacterium]